jgi:hypothetical protein
MKSLSALSVKDYAQVGPTDLIRVGTKMSYTTLPPRQDVNVYALSVSLHQL